MKKIVILLGLAASFFMFAGCSSGNAYEQPTAVPAAEPAPASAPAHHDYKGEK